MGLACWRKCCYGGLELVVVFGWNKVEDGFLAWDGLGERFWDYAGLVIKIVQLFCGE